MQKFAFLIPCGLFSLVSLILCLQAAKQSYDWRKNRAAGIPPHPDWEGLNTTPAMLTMGVALKIFLAGLGVSTLILLVG